MIPPARMCSTFVHGMSARFMRDVRKWRRTFEGDMPRLTPQDRAVRDVLTRETAWLSGA